MKRVWTEQKNDNTEDMVIPPGVAPCLTQARTGPKKQESGLAALTLPYPTSETLNQDFVELEKLDSVQTNCVDVSESDLVTFVEPTLIETEFKPTVLTFPYPVSKALNEDVEQLVKSDRVRTSCDDVSKTDAVNLLKPTPIQAESKPASLTLPYPISKVWNQNFEQLGKMDEVQASDDVSKTDAVTLSKPTPFEAESKPAALALPYPVSKELNQNVEQLGKLNGDQTSCDDVSKTDVVTFLKPTPIQLESEPAGLTCSYPETLKQYGEELKKVKKVETSFDGARKAAVAIPMDVKLNLIQAESEPDRLTYTLNQEMDGVQTNCDDMGKMDRDDPLDVKPTTIKEESKLTYQYPVSETLNHSELFSAVDNLIVCPPGKPLVCDMCDRTFTRKLFWYHHMMMHAGKKSYLCHLCDKGFYDGASLRRHIMVHSGDKPFTCDVCDKSFTQKGNLQKHMRGHSGEKPFSCVVCYKTFSSTQNLKVHLLVHTKEKPFSCEVCQRSFSIRSTLRKHMMLHSGDRPFACNMCDKAFTQNGNLQKHLFLHSKVKPYSCELCDKEFNRKEQLKKHLEMHENGKHYECEVCQGKFFSRSDLKIHMFTHYNDKCFVCDVCGKPFARKRYLRSHKKTHLKKIQVTSKSESGSEKNSSC